MAKRRYLPKYVTVFTDRHGRQRFRFRRKGYPSRYINAALGSPEFLAEYARLNSPEGQREHIEDLHRARTIPGSLGDLLRRYVAVPSRLGPTEATQRKIQRILERFAQGREDRPVAGLTFEHIDAIIEREKTKRIEGKRTVGGIEAARKLRKELNRLFEFGKAIRMLTVNPVDGSSLVKTPPSERSKGYYSWTEADIEQYRNHWPLGSRQRLALELLLWTDQRKVDTIHLGPSDISGGRFMITQSKTGKDLVLPIVPQLLEAMEAMPASDAPCFLMTQKNRPFTVAGFGNWFRDQCDAAGLPRCTAHGLRKATLRRMAELEMPNASMKSVSGHSKDDEIRRYIEAANQEKLAKNSLTALSRWERDRE